MLRVDSDVYIVYPGETVGQITGHLSCALVIPTDFPLENISALDAKQVITYGVSGQSTLTVSSILDNGAVMALQREIVDITGRRVGRQEVKRVSNKGIERLLAETARDIVAGRI